MGMTSYPSITASSARMGSVSVTMTFAPSPFAHERDALAAPAVAGYDNVFAGDDKICRAADTVPNALAGAVAVIEHVLAVGIVYHDHREAQRTGSGHDAQAVNAGRCLLAAADNAGDEVCKLLVHEVDEVAAVVNDNIGADLEHLAGVKSSYCCSVQQYSAKTFMPPAASAAATSS